MDDLIWGIETQNELMLRRHGLSIDITKAEQDYAASLGKTINQLSVYEKKTAITNAVLEKLKGVTGLYEISQRTSAGQMQSNIRIMNEFRGAIGKPFEQALFNLVKGFNEMVKAMTAALNPGGRLYNVLYKLAVVAGWLFQILTSVFNTIASLFGVTATASGQTASNTGQTADNLGEAADNAGDLANNTQAAGKAAKGSLAAFDELNVLQQDTGEGGGGGAGGGGEPIPLQLPFDFSQIQADIDAFNAKVEEFKNSLIQKFGPIIEAFDRLKKALAPLGETIWKGLQWAWDNILMPMGNWVLNEAVPSFMDLLGGAATLLNTALIALQPLGQWLWDNFLKPVAEWTGGVIIDVMQKFTDLLYRISDWIKANPDTFRSIAIAVGILAGAFILANIVLGIWNVVAGIGTAVTGAFAAVMGFLASPVLLVMGAILLLVAIVYVLIKYWPQISQAAKDAWNAIKDTWDKVATWFNDNVITPVKNWFSEAWENIKQWASDAWDNIKGVWDVVSQWFDDNVIKPVKNWFDQAWKDIKGFFSSAWTNIQGVWTVVSTWFNDNVVSPVKGWFSGALDDIEGFFSTAWTNIQKTWNTVSTWFQTNVIDPLKNAWDILLHGEDGNSGIEGAWQTVWDGLKETVLGVVNGIIGIINGLISGVCGGINAIIDALNAIKITIPGWVPEIGGQTIGFSLGHVPVPQIPLLASGAVIPPNAAFLAMLGEQRSGKNIEAPEALLRQLIREELGAMETTVNVRFSGGLSQLIRQMKPAIDAESVRIGKSMISGAAT